MGKIRVRMISARNLTPADSNGFSDPYVAIAVAGEAKNAKNFKNTATVKKNLNPSWNESFELELGATPTHRQLTFHVFDWDMLSAHDPLGSVSVSVDDLYKGEEKLQWYTLHNTKHGELQIGLTALDFGLDRAAQQHHHQQFQHQGYPQQGYPPQGYQQQQQPGYPSHGFPLQQQQHGYPPQQQGYPQQGYPPQQQGYASHGYPQHQQGYPQQHQQGYPQQQGYNPSYGQHHPQQQGYPAQGQAPAPMYSQPAYDSAAYAAHGKEDKVKDGKKDKDKKKDSKVDKKAGNLFKGLVSVSINALTSSQRIIFVLAGTDPVLGWDKIKSIVR